MYASHVQPFTILKTGVGAGKRAPGAIAEAIHTGNRLALGQTAPARGLTLERVLYEGDEDAALAYFPR